MRTISLRRLKRAPEHFVLFEGKFLLEASGLHNRHGGVELSLLW